MHPNLKLNTEVSGVVGNLPIVDKFGEGGISINELSDRFSIPFPLVRSSLQQCDWVVKFRRGGREYFTNINRVRHMVETPDGFQTLSILWYNWRYKGKVDILREVDVEFISDFFSRQGVPPLHLRRVDGCLRLLSPRRVVHKIREAASFRTNEDNFQ